MPNQRAANKKSVTVAMPTKLVDQIDALARKEERSRSKIIEMILRDKLAEHHEPEDLAVYNQAKAGGKK